MFMGNKQAGLFIQVRLLVGIFFYVKRKMGQRSMPSEICALRPQKTEQRPEELNGYILNKKNNDFIFLKSYKKQYRNRNCVWSTKPKVFSIWTIQKNVCWTLTLEATPMQQQRMLAGFTSREKNQAPQRHIIAPQNTEFWEQVYSSTSKLLWVRDCNWL